MVTTNGKVIRMRTWNEEMDSTVWRLRTMSDRFLASNRTDLCDRCEALATRVSARMVGKLKSIGAFQDTQ